MSLPLSDHVLFASTAVEDARVQVGSVFCPHELRPLKSKPKLSARMHHAKISQDSSVSYLAYGDAVVVEPGRLNDFFNIQVQFSGSVKTRCGDQLVDVQPGEAAVLSPSEYTSMEWNADSGMLIYSVSRQLVERSLASVLGFLPNEPLVFDASMTRANSQSAGWLQAMALLVSELNGPTGFLNCASALENFEKSLVCSLVFAQPHNYSEQLHSDRPRLVPALIKQAERYIDQNYDQRICIDDIAAASNTCVRTLFAAFKRYHNVTPMVYLRNVRLDQARLAILGSQPSDENVTGVALQCGFTQLGRFAKYYKDRFGELPSETLLQRRGSVSTRHIVSKH